MAPRDRKPAVDGKKLPPPSPLIDRKEVSEIIDLMIEKGVSEFEVERPGLRIKIARPSPSAIPSHPIPEAPPSAAVHAPAVAKGGGKAAALEASPIEEVYVVRSPMVGTFYSAPSQGSDPFIRVGDRVQVGQVLCIIEAMKLMNEIECETAGEIVKCYAENGQPVEYGEPLFDIKPLARQKTGGK